RCRSRRCAASTSKTSRASTSSPCGWRSARGIRPTRLRSPSGPGPEPSSTFSATRPRCPRAAPVRSFRRKFSFGRAWPRRGPWPRTARRARETDEPGAGDGDPHLERGAGRGEGARDRARAGRREGQGQGRAGGAVRAAGDNRTRRMMMGRVVAVLVLLVVAAVAGAQSTETAGMITEIKTGRGRVEVRSTGDWRRSGPLQTLRAGDTVRAIDDAVAVVMLSGGGTVKIDAANSPYAVPARTDDTRSQKARTLVQAGLGFLAAGQREAPTAILSTRD